MQSEEAACELQRTDEGRRSARLGRGRPDRDRLGRGSGRTGEIPGSGLGLAWEALFVALRDGELDGGMAIAGLVFLAVPEILLVPVFRGRRRRIAACPPAPTSPQASAASRLRIDPCHPRAAGTASGVRSESLGRSPAHSARMMDRGSESAATTRPPRRAAALGHERRSWRP